MSFSVGKIKEIEEACKDVMEELNYKPFKPASAEKPKTA